MGPLEGIRVVELSTGIAGPVAGMLLGRLRRRGRQGRAAERRSGPRAGRLRRLEPQQAERRRRSARRAGPPAPRRAAGRRRPLHLRRSVVARRRSPPPIRAWCASTCRRTCRTRRPGPAAPSPTSCWRPSAGSSSRQSSFDGGPIHLVYPFALYEQGVWAAACAVAALIERQPSGLGQTVTVAGIHGVLACSPGAFALDPNQPPLPTNVGAGGRHPCYSTFQCGDGKWLFMAALDAEVPGQRLQGAGRRQPLRRPAHRRPVRAGSSCPRIAAGSASCSRARSPPAPATSGWRRWRSATARPARWRTATPGSTIPRSTRTACASRSTIPSAGTS